MLSNQCSGFTCKISAMNSSSWILSSEFPSMTFFHHVLSRAVFGT
jgi:hypothetical protein